MPFLVAARVRPGPRRRHDPADRVRRHRPDSPRAPAAADVRGALDGLGPARRDRPGDRRHGRRGGRLAVRLPGPAAAHRARRRADARGAPERGRRSARRRRDRARPPRPPAARHHGRPRGRPPDRRADQRRADPDRRAERRRHPDRPLRAPEADPARHARRPAGPAGGGPPPRDPHLHVLRGRRLRRADARRLARRVGDGGRHRADLGHHRVDRRGVDPGPRRHALADLAVRPGRLPGHPGRPGRDDRRAAIRT